MEAGNVLIWSGELALFSLRFLGLLTPKVEGRKSAPELNRTTPLQPADWGHGEKRWQKKH